MPQAMKRVAKRLGQAAGTPAASGAWPHTGIDSSHGRAMATPAPWRKARREMAVLAITAGLWSQRFIEYGPLWATPIRGRGRLDSFGELSPLCRRISSRL